MAEGFTITIEPVLSVTKMPSVAYSKRAPKPIIVFTCSAVINRFSVEFQKYGLFVDIYYKIQDVNTFYF